MFGNSPDETAFYRLTLNRLTVPDAMVAIQPSLMAYSLEGPPQPVLLDVASIQADRVLFLDACFSIVIFHGQTIAQWRGADYHKQEGYENFRAMLEVCVCVCCHVLMAMQGCCTGHGSGTPNGRLLAGMCWKLSLAGTTCDLQLQLCAALLA